MIFTIDMETFKQIAKTTSPVYMYEEYNKITLYTAKTPMILRTVYEIPVDEETGIPRTEDLMMWKASYFTDAIQVLGVKEEQSIRMTVTQG